MNQQCKVCGEPAAGFHFGAFTCEGCKSFFGRSYNNLNSITECKNNGECIINKKNRTTCKSCRLRKCLLVGMSKSGSRYGRRSNWFKIHCLLQEQQQAAVAQVKGKSTSASPLENSLLSPLAFPHPNLGNFLRPNNSSSPSVSSPDSDSSEFGLHSNGTFTNKDFYLPVPFHSIFMQPQSMASSFLFPPSILPFSGVPSMKRHESSQRLLSPDDLSSCHKRSPELDVSEEGSIRTSDSPLSQHSSTNNNEYNYKHTNELCDSESYKSKCNSNCSKSNNIIISNNNNEKSDDNLIVRSKRFYLDSILGLKSVGCESPNRRKSREEEMTGRFGQQLEKEQDNPIDLSVKSSAILNRTSCLQDEDTTDVDEEKEETQLKSKIYNNCEEIKTIPLDLRV